MKPYYQDELITLYNEDCRKVVPYLNTHSLLLTDPPYGIAKLTKMTAHYISLPNGKREWTAAVDNSAWDSAPPPQWLLDQLIDKCYNAIIFGGNYYRLPPARCWLVWDKGVGEEAYYAHCELAWTNLPTTVKKIRCLWSGMMREGKEVKYHPAQKPLRVMIWAMEKRSMLTKGVLDPFAGCGTTLVAAKMKGVKATGIEINQKYCDIIIKRLQRVKTTPVFKRGITFKEVPC